MYSRHHCIIHFLIGLALGIAALAAQGQTAAVPIDAATQAPVESVTATVTLNGPSAPGVPLNSPVPVIVIPAGAPLEVHA